MSKKKLKFIHALSPNPKTLNIMKNRNIEYQKQAAKIYSDAYKPSTNIFRFVRSILGALLHGSSVHGYSPTDKRIIR
jgi:hypothetical protein